MRGVSWGKYATGACLQKRVQVEEHRDEADEKA